MEDRLAGSCAGVHNDTVVRQPVFCSDFGDELEHPLRFVGRELADLVERRDVPLGQDEQMRVGLWVEIADRHVIAFAVELAEEAVLLHAASTPSSCTPAPRT